MLFNPTSPPTDLDAAFFALVGESETPPSGGVSLTPEQAAAIALIPELLEQIEALNARFDALPPGPVAVIPAATDPAQTMAHGVTRTASGNPEGGISVTIQLTSTGGVNGFFEKEFTVTSSSEPATLGRIAVPLLKGATYRAKRETGTFRFFTTTEADTFEMPVFFGP